MAMRIQLRRGTSAEWTSANPVLAEGESGLETDTGNVKYGDGVRPWAELPYSVAVPGPGEVIVGSEDGPVVAPGGSLLRSGVPDPAPRRETVVTTFAPGHGWTKFGSVGTVDVNDASDGALSGQSMRMTTPGDGSLVQAQGAVASPVNLRDNVVKIYLKFTNMEEMDQVNLFVYDSLAKTAERLLTFSPNSHSQSFEEGAWGVVTLDYGWTSPAGTLDLTNVGAFLFLIKDKNRGVAATMRVGGISLVPRKHPAFPDGVVSITFDDGLDSVYTRALPAMAAHDFRGTAYIIQESLGKAGYNTMTLDQVRRLHQINRWEIGHHAWTLATHTNDYPSLTDAQVHEDFRLAKHWAATHGLGTLDTHAWPHGVSSRRDRRIAGQYFASARSTSNTGFGQPFLLQGGDLRYTMRTAAVDGSAAYENYPTTQLDPLKAHGGWLILMCHAVHDSTENSLTARTDKFQALVDAIAARDIPVLPVNEVLAKLAVPE